MTYVSKTFTEGNTKNREGKAGSQMYITAARIAEQAATATMNRDAAFAQHVSQALALVAEDADNDDKEAQT